MLQYGQAETWRIYASLPKSDGYAGISNQSVDTQRLGSIQHVSTEYSAINVRYASALDEII